MAPKHDDLLCVVSIPFLERAFMNPQATSLAIVAIVASAAVCGCCCLTAIGRIPKLTLSKRPFKVLFWLSLREWMKTFLGSTWQLVAFSTM